MNLYPIYGHIGFKLFFAACAFRAAEFARDTATDRRQLLEELRKLNRTLAAQPPRL
jgi:hypothetical protein